MKIIRAFVLAGMSVLAAAGAQMVITATPIHQGGKVPEGLRTGDVTVTQGSTNVPVVQLQRLAGSMADMQLFLYLDDSTRSSSLGIQLPELKTFLKSLPRTTQVAVGYMHNGTFALAQAFTTDHQKAADALRLPAAIPGENGSPYFALSDLVKRWPSQEATGRRAVLALTDGVDRYYSAQIEDDPYVDAAIGDALKNGVAIYSIYLRGAGLYGRGGWATTMAQSRLIQVSQETGGYAYFQDLSDPVTIAPFLSDFQDRLDNQYLLTFQPLNGRGTQQVKLRTEVPGVKVEGPSRVYVR
ncbi:exported hypothetical protein [Candidatus Sulfopaludibacter sp. SbA3]|nr:exported hypothetical protein [Candidatus Sulfopaludibacter sp. SbA3]